MRVSARLQATAAPDAPAPMISTSTVSSRGRAVSGVSSAATSLPSLVAVAPHWRPAAHRVEQGPVARLQIMALGVGRPRFAAERAHDAVVAVVALQHHPSERGDGRLVAAEQG